MWGVLLLLLASLIPPPPPPVADVHLLRTPYGAVLLWQQQSDATTVVVAKETMPGAFVGIATIEGSTAGPHGALDISPAPGERYFIGECWREPGLRCLPSYGPYQLYRAFFPRVSA
jgi:hypothetical protein